MHDAYIGGCSENSIKCIVVHEDLGWKNRTTLYILPRHWLYEWFSQFHSCGTYSVLSWSPSNVLWETFWGPGLTWSNLWKCRPEQLPMGTTFAICIVTMYCQLIVYVRCLLRCITWELEGIRQRGCPKKTWWNCVKNDVESLGLSQKDAQSRNKWRRRIKGQPANPGSPGKMAVKTVWMSPTYANIMLTCPSLGLAW